MFTITGIFQSDYRVKGSKFLGFLYPAASVIEAENALEEVKNEHPAATHHCYAWLINPHEPVEFASDAGEPGGTAGLPILNTMRSENIMNAILIVVRYYGGTKLGKAGLIAAYAHSAERTIKTANLKQIVPIKTYRIEYNYSRQGFIDKLKNDFTWFETEAVYLETVKIVCGCPVSEADLFEKKLDSIKHLFENVEALGESFHIE